MIGIIFVVTVEGNLPFIAIALNKVPNPLLLFWREWSVATFIFILELHAMQIPGNGFAHGSEIFLHHTVKETTES